MYFTAIPLNSDVYVLKNHVLPQLSIRLRCRFGGLVHEADRNRAGQTPHRKYKIQNCHSREDVIQLLLEREFAFKDYRDKYRKLIDCIRPVVQVVHAFSGVLGETSGIVLVSLSD